MFQQQKNSTAQNENTKLVVHLRILETLNTIATVLSLHVRKTSTPKQI